MLVSYRLLAVVVFVCWCSFCLLRGLLWSDRVQPGSNKLKIDVGVRNCKAENKRLILVGLVLGLDIHRDRPPRI